MNVLPLKLIFVIGGLLLANNLYANEQTGKTQLFFNDPVIETVDLDISGVNRQYQLYTTAGLASGLRAPKALMFDFHGSGSHPQEQLAISNSPQIAKSIQALLVLPIASRPFARGGFTWNTPYQKEFDDDITFSQAIIEQLEKRFDLSALPVVITGFSGGARMASLLACKMPDRIAAVALVAGVRQPELDREQCHETDTTHIVSFHSTKDAINPYRQNDESSNPPYWQYGVEEAIKAWANRYECEAKPSHVGVNDTVDLIRYQQCADDTRLISYRLAEGGHTWPGSQFKFPDYLGSVNKSIDATTIISSFFQASLSGN